MSVAFIVGILSLIARDPIGLVLAFVSVFTVAFFSWFFVTTRGYRRLLGAPPVFLALVAVFTVAYDHKLALPVLIGMLVLFGLVARYAVRHARTPVQIARRHARPAEPAQRGVLIINPNSGGGKAKRFNLPEEAKRRNIEPLLLGRDDDLRELARRAVTLGADVIGMAGGDGSQALIASVAMKHDVPHVCVPAGTRNHFALDLGLNRDDVVGALDAFTDGVERRIDLASLNERIFVNNASLGVYAGIVQSDAYRDAKLGTWKRMLPEMLGRGAVVRELHFDAPHPKDWSNAALVVVSNNPYQMRRFRGTGTRPRLDTGRLGIFAARLRGAGGVARLVTFETIGRSLGSRSQHRRLSGVLQWSCLEFEVRAAAPVAVGLDGEALMLAPPLRFVSLPGALRVRVPRHARGVSPAAAAVPLTPRNLGALLRIAAGRPVEVPSQR
ncbi:MAG TPA: diacylglycerol kinase family protein [Gaiellaceae bacterium]|nr:diacylglycerol kinase family protein [Gaiellaceae bacterium]